MDAEHRLQKLVSTIELARQKGFIQCWPDEIRKEVVYLRSIFGQKIISEKTKISTSTQYKWSQKYPNEEPEKTTALKEDNIFVTRIVANSDFKEPAVEKTTVIASVVKNHFEFKIYCEKLANEVVKRILI